LLDTIPIIEIKRAASLPRAVRRNPQHEILLAQLGGRVRRLCAQGEDGAAADVQRDAVERHIREVYPLALPFNLLERPPVVPHPLWQVDANGCAVLLQHGGDEDVVAVEELVLDGEGVLVLGVEEEERVEQGQARGGLAVEGGVDVVEQAVADGMPFFAAEVVSGQR